MLSISQSSGALTLFPQQYLYLETLPHARAYASYINSLKFLCVLTSLRPSQGFSRPHRMLSLPLVCAWPLHPWDMRVRVPNGPRQCLTWKQGKGPRRASSLGRPAASHPSELHTSCSSKFIVTGSSQKMLTCFMSSKCMPSVPSEASDAVSPNLSSAMHQTGEEPRVAEGHVAHQQPSQDLVQAIPLSLEKEET